MVVAPLLGGIDQAFQYIQEWTGIVSPGILAIFILGLFWKKTTARAAITGAVLSIPVAFYFKVAPKGWSQSGLFVDLPFMHQMGLTFLITVVIMLVLSHVQNKGVDDPKGISLSKSLFKTSPTFNVLSFAVMLMLVVLYALFW
jgi:SSS family solute:Na+ symporter